MLEASTQMRQESEMSSDQTLALQSPTWESRGEGDHSKDFLQFGKREAVDATFITWSNTYYAILNTFNEPTGVTLLP